MGKLKLSIEVLQVESFTTARAVSPQGTVRARALGTGLEDCTLPTDFNNCGPSNPCTTDGPATIDAKLCEQSVGCDGTVAAMTCQPEYGTGFCCGISANRTMVCCQGTANCPPG
jgi:hypothetical protein